MSCYHSEWVSWYPQLAHCESDNRSSRCAVANNVIFASGLHLTGPSILLAESLEALQSQATIDFFNSMIYYQYVSKVLALL